ncbi:MAG: hypothetical protein ABSC08_04770, partial [Bryobacteraceae bacterium]
IGPNPFHVHEFEYEEFREALTAVFPSVTLYLQNHVGGLSFQPVAARTAQSPDVHLESSQSDPHQAHFFVAVCAAARQTGAPAFLHVPSTSNVLRERESHVRKLEDEIRLKDNWLRQHQGDLSQLLGVHAAQKLELERAQSWAQTEHEHFEAARRELMTTVQAYEDRLAANERAANEILDRRVKELESAQAWAQSEHEQFEASRRELLATVQAYEDRLAANERAANEILDGRTKEFEGAQAWALSIQQEFEALGNAYRAQTAELQNAQKWAQSEHEQFEASRRELLALAQAYEDRLAANERAANDLLNQRAKELEKAQKWAQFEHEQFEALGRELLATSERYEALSAVNERRHQEDLSALNRRFDETEDQRQATTAEIGRLKTALDELTRRLAETESDRQAGLAEINRLRTILSAVHESRWVKLGRSIKVGPDLGSV